MIQRLRSFGISWTCSAMNWSTETFVSADVGPITLSDRFGLWLEAQFSRLFGWLYNGSDREIEDALEGLIPRRCMSERQRKFAHLVSRDDLKWTDFFDEFFCVDCEDELSVSDEARLCAHCRALHPEMLLEDSK